MAILNHLLILVLFLVGFLSASCELHNKVSAPAPPPPPGPSPGYNFFKLALQWPNSYCRRYKQNICKPTVPPNQFTIHGLWPLFGGGKAPPACCSTNQQLTEATLTKLRAKLTTNWPRLESKDEWESSKKLWYAQWRSYGSCSSNKHTPEQYFTKATDLAAKYGADILSKFQAEGINPDGRFYGTQEILDAIKKATGFTADIKCSKDHSCNIQLLEIHLCVKEDGVKLQNCGQSGRPINCDSKDRIIFPSAPIPPGFDYFLLSLQWPNAFCKETGKNCQPRVPPNYFTIHGLWPQKNNQETSMCDTIAQMTDATLEERQCDLLKYWPQLPNADSFDRSKNFWIYQWDKHGTCSSNEFLPQVYLERTIDLGQKYGQLLVDKLTEKRITPDGTTGYTAKQVLDAIKEATKTAARIQCTFDGSQKLQLSEIRLCVKKDGKTLQDCSGNQQGQCNGKFIFASPPSPTPTHLPSFVSPIQEVEEVVGL